MKRTLAHDSIVHNIVHTDTSESVTLNIKKTRLLMAIWNSHSSGVPPTPTMITRWREQYGDELIVIMIAAFFTYHGGVRDHKLFGDALARAKALTELFEVAAGAEIS